VDPPSSVQEFERKVVAEARRFDLKPLLDLLRAKGFARSDIFFESTRQASSLVDAIRFEKHPIERVVLTVNLGLLASGALIPSYFFEIVDRTPEPERFYEFIRFFDHWLISGLVEALYPEDDPRVFRDWNGVRRSFVRMLGVPCISTLHWIAALQFPELGVHVERLEFASETESHAIRAGISILDGSSVLGMRHEADAAGFVIELTAEEETDARGRGWAAVLRERLNEQLLPMLAVHRVALSVRLRVLEHASWAHLETGGKPSGYLGYDRLRDKASSGHTIVLYRGITGVTLRA
jgi:hypothetical protein